jgi:methyl-accepting chemotaxis protein
MDLLRLAKSRAFSENDTIHETLAAALEPSLDEIVERFYQRLRNDPAQRAMISKIPDPEGLKRALKDHWLFVLSRAPDEETKNRARRIGAAHARVELSPAVYIESYGVLFNSLAGVVLARAPRERALVSAMTDQLFADMGAALTSFFTGTESMAREREAIDLVKTVETEMDASNAVAASQAAALLSIVDDLGKVLNGLRGGVALVKDGTATASGSVGAVASAIEELHCSSQEVGRQANDADALAHEAVAKADEAERRFARLAASAARVTEIVGLIAGISNQTSLLALNAAIEAARAGENGRGFAVVANEVKSLSQRTNAATRDISGQIAEIEAATQAALVTMKEVRDIIGGISGIAAAVAQSSGQQVEAVQSIGHSANSAASGAASLDSSVDMFTTAMAEADQVGENVASQSRQVGTLFERLSTRLTVTLKDFSDFDRRRFPRSPARVSAELRFNGRTISADIVEISEGGALIGGLAEKLAPGALVEAELKEVGRLRARAASAGDFGQRLQFIETPETTATALKALMQRLFAREEILRRIVIDRSKMIAGLFEDALRKGEISEPELFDVNYVAIPETNPRQYRNCALDFLERSLPALQEPILEMDSAVVFSAAVDRNGYLPVHNRKYSQAQGKDPEWNNAHCRNRRIFDDLTGLMAGRNKQEFLSQTYPRDLGGGRLELIKDISAPIVVNGKHWGGLRMGAKIA